MNICSVIVTSATFQMHTAHRSCSQADGDAAAAISSLSGNGAEAAPNIFEATGENDSACSTISSEKAIATTGFSRQG